MVVFDNGSGYQYQGGNPAPFDRSQSVTQPLEKYGWWDVFSGQANIDRESTSLQSYVQNWFDDQSQAHIYKGKDLNKRYGTSFGADDPISQKSLSRALDLQAKQRFVDAQAATLDNGAAATSAKMLGGVLGSSTAPLDAATFLIPYGKLAGLAGHALEGVTAASKIEALARAGQFGSRALEFGFEGRGVAGGIRRGVLEGGITGAGMSAYLAAQGSQYTGTQFTWQDAALNMVGGGLMGGAFGGIGGMFDRRGLTGTRASSEPGALESGVYRQVANGETPMTREAQQAFFESADRASQVHEQVQATGETPHDLTSTPLREYSTPHDNLLYIAQKAGDHGEPAWLRMAGDAQHDLAEAAIVAERGDHVQADMSMSEGLKKLEALVHAGGADGEVVPAMLDHIRDKAPSIAKALEAAIAAKEGESAVDRVNRVTDLHKQVTDKLEGPKGLGTRLNALADKGAQTMQELMELTRKHGEAEAAGGATAKLAKSIASRQKVLDDLMEKGRPLLMQKSELDMQASLLKNWLEGEGSQVAEPATTPALAHALTWGKFTQDLTPEGYIRRLTNKVEQVRRWADNMNPDTGAWHNPAAEKTELQKLKRVRTPLTAEEWADGLKTKFAETHQIITSGLGQGIDVPLPESVKAHLQGLGMEAPTMKDLLTHLDEQMNGINKDQSILKQGLEDAAACVLGG